MSLLLLVSCRRYWSEPCWMITSRRPARRSWLDIRAGAGDLPDALRSGREGRSVIDPVASEARDPRCVSKAAPYMQMQITRNYYIEPPPECSPDPIMAGSDAEL